ncbi:unnamed protein product [Amoebophrya sp. A120]|nr:unnamed protein product [Amoebophrya sp. A120]|eukprot:GSA120T00009286001.1
MNSPSVNSKLSTSARISSSSQRQKQDNDSDAGEDLVPEPPKQKHRLLKFLPKFYGKDQRKKLTTRIEYSIQKSRPNTTKSAGTNNSNNSTAGRGVLQRQATRENYEYYHGSLMLESDLKEIASLENETRHCTTTTKVDVTGGTTASTRTKTTKNSSKNMNNPAPLLSFHPLDRTRSSGNSSTAFYKEQVHFPFPGNNSVASQSRRWNSQISSNSGLVNKEDMDRDIDPSEVDGDHVDKEVVDDAEEKTTTRAKEDEKESNSAPMTPSSALLLSTKMDKKSINYNDEENKTRLLGTTQPTTGRDVDGENDDQSSITNNSTVNFSGTTATAPGVEGENASATSAGGGAPAMRISTARREDLPLRRTASSLVKLHLRGDYDTVFGDAKTLTRLMNQNCFTWHVQDNNSAALNGTKTSAIPLMNHDGSGYHMLNPSASNTRSYSTRGSLESIDWNNHDGGQLRVTLRVNCVSLFGLNCVSTACHFLDVLLV